MKIGVIADTHSYLDPQVFKYFKDVDEIWHAGDIGEISVLEQLQSFKTTKAVYGNIDGHPIRSQIPEDLIFEVDGYKVFMTHIAAKPPRYHQRVQSLIQHEHPHMLVCGHSHILKVEFDKSNKLLFVNPGAAGRHGFHKIRTLIRFDLINAKPQHMEVIELGKRGCIAPTS